MICQCENSRCKHGDGLCINHAQLFVKTIFGAFAMCADCANNMSEKYIEKVSLYDVLK